jgi:hypothetical protein
MGFRKIVLNVILLVLLLNLTAIEPTSAQQTNANERNIVTLFASKPYTCSSLKDQWFEDSLTLQPGQEKLPLNLIVVNGSAHSPAYNWFRITIAGYLVASEKDLKGSNEASIDVSGQMQPGRSQIIIEAGGKLDSSLSFWLTTKPVTVNYIHPRSALLSDSVTIGGTNFSTNAGDNVVTFDSKAAQVISASNNYLTVKVPQSCDIGMNRLLVTVNGLKSNAVPIYISHAPAPELLSLEYWMVPPGATLTIQGRNFAPNLSDNKVYFGSVQANVVSGDANSLVVVVPNWGYGPQEINVPISVVSNNVPSVNQLPIDIGPRFCGQIPQFPQD